MPGPANKIYVEREMAAVDDEGGVDMALERATTTMNPLVTGSSEQSLLDGNENAATGEVTDEELATALAAAEDEYGVDQRLAAMTAAMTDEERAQAHASIRRWIDAARKSRESEHATSDHI